MLRALLIERFSIQAHTETRPITAYTLVAANPKLKPADPNTRTSCKEGPGPDGKDPRTTNGAVSFIDAVSRQLGLKLEKRKRPLPVLVLDHIEQVPTAN